MFYLFLSVVFLLVVTEAKELHLCEGQGNVIRCPKDHKLQILIATYGRSDSTTCAKSTSEDYKKCVRIVTDAVKNLCLGKQSCVLNANKRLLGKSRSCGVNDYLKVDYLCHGSIRMVYLYYDHSPKPQTTARPIHPSSETTTKASVDICQYGSVTLQCKDGGEINVASVFWGKQTGVNKCSSIYDWGFYDDDEDKCKSVSAQDTVARLCNGRARCDVEATTHILGNPCWGMTKYLKIAYQCKVSTKPPPITHNKILCEGRSSFIGCDEGGQINVVKATFGKSTSDVCPSNKTTVDIADCKKDVTHVFKTMIACQAHKYCNVAASTQMLGDPCPGTSKYLDISFECTH